MPVGQSTWDGIGGAVDTADNLLRAANRVASTLASSITDSDMEITLSSAPAALPASGAITIYGAGGTPIEIVYYSSRVGAVLTVSQRGAQGTTASAFDAGATVQMRVTAAHHNLLASSIITLQGAVDARLTQADADLLYQPLGGLTASRALISNGSGVIVASTVTSTELGHLSGVTSAIQTQLDGKLTQAAADALYAPLAHSHIIADVTGLQTALDSKQATGNYITSLTGHVTATGPGSVAATIAAGVVTNDMLAGSIAISKLATTGTPDNTNYLRGDGSWQVVDTTISGSDTHVMFFDGANNPAGDAGLTFNKTTDTLTVATALNVGTYNTSLYTIKTGAFTLQPYALNNGFIADNAYFNGTTWTRLTTGYATGFQFYQGQLMVFNAPTATGAFSQSVQLKLDDSGTFGVGQGISQIRGQWTNSYLFMNGTTGFVGLLETSPGGRLQVNTAGASIVGVIIKAAASQSANLLNLLASDGTTVLSGFTASGALGVGTGSPALKADIVVNNAGGSVLRLQNTSASGYSTVVFTNAAGTIMSGVGHSNAAGYLYVDAATTHVRLHSAAASQVPLQIHATGQDFSGIEYLNTAGAVGVFTGFRNSTGEFRFNNIIAGGTIEFKINSVSALTINNSGSVTKTSAGIGTTSTDGIVLENTTAAAAGAQQYSPRTVWAGRGWKTNATAASQDVRFSAEVIPVQGAANPSGTWSLSSSINGGAYATAFSVTSAGTATASAFAGSSLISAGTLTLRASAGNTITIGGHVEQQTININSYGQLTLSGHGLTGSIGALATTQISTTRPLVVRGAASQSANLTEWQNSSSTVLASISAGGKITTADYIVISDSTKGLLIGTASPAVENFLIDARRNGFAQLYLEGNSTTAGAADFMLKDAGAGANAKFYSLRCQAGSGEISSYNDSGAYQIQGIIKWANLTGALTFKGPSVSPATSDGTALGTTALMWSDLFLASGAVVNFNNGDFTITHAAGKLTFSGEVEFDGALNHDGSTVGFFGVAPATQPTALTTEDGGTVNSGDATTDGVINNLRTRIAELEDKLQALGLLA